MFMTLLNRFWIVNIVLRLMPKMNGVRYFYRVSDKDGFDQLISTVFIVLKEVFYMIFSIPKQLQNLDPSYKMS